MKLTYKLSLTSFQSVKSQFQMKGQWHNRTSQHKKWIMDKFKLSARQFDLFRRGFRYIEFDVFENDKFNRSWHKSNKGE